MNLMERFADPVLMPAMSLTEKLAGAGVTALMGMGVTFVVLFLLWACIAVMGRITVRFTGGPGNPSENRSGNARHKSSSENQGDCFMAVPEGEIISVISAAIAAACEESPLNKCEHIAIKSIRRSRNDGWAQLGRWEGMR